MNRSVFRFLLLLAALVAGGAVVDSAAAEDLSAVKARMNDRLAQVDQLKVSGAIGENNRGFLEDRGGGANAAAVIAAENKDRAAVYAVIAEKTGTSADEVGRKRAQKIAATSPRGVWIQAADGTWQRK